MLVLTRKLNGEIVIGDNITITVLQIKGNSIRLGIDAPRDVRIVRGELPPEPQNAPDKPAAADVTVVFSNDREQMGNQLQIVKCDEETKEQNGAELSNSRTEDSPKSMHFRSPVPEALQHNRLQQIVNELTQK